MCQWFVGRRAISAQQPILGLRVRGLSVLECLLDRTPRAGFARYVTLTGSWGLVTMQMGFSVTSLVGIYPLFSALREWSVY